MIAIQPFGDFKIKSGGEVMSLRHFKSKKVLSLIKYLIFNQNNPYSSDELYDQFCFDSDNPSSALKNLIYRAKLLISETNLPEDQYIILKDGVYYWNKDIEIKLINEEFENAVLKGNDRKLSLEERVSAYELAADLYKDYFLLDIQYEKWVVPLTRYYHNLYISCVNNLCSIYDEINEQKKLEAVCRRAIKIDSHQEDIYVRLMQSLMKQNRYQEAYDTYCTAENVFFDELGASLTSETKQLYKKIMSCLTNEERNIEVIKNDLLNEEETVGAFVCNYEIFKSIYRVYHRTMQRSKDTICILLATLVKNDGTIPEKDEIVDNMKIMENILKRVLRMGDVVSRYSGTQFVIMLPNLLEPDVNKVIKRIKDEFRRKTKSQDLNFSTRADFIPKIEP